MKMLVVVLMGEEREQIHGEAQKTLVSLACVNKTFSESALDMLWRTLDGPLPLLALLPEHAVKKTVDGDSLRVVSSVFG